MKAPFLHAPDGRARIDSIRFARWIVSIPSGKRDKAARVARYLAIRANRNNQAKENSHANHQIRLS
jgi:hypothetical protein